MKKDTVIPAIVLIAGVILLCQGVFGGSDERHLATTGAILVGSWYVARSLTK